jgi:hypothetical protein
VIEANGELIERRRQSGGWPSLNRRHSISMRYFGRAASGLSAHVVDPPAHCFGDLAAYKAKIAEYQAAYEKQLAEERALAN